MGGLEAIMLATFAAGAAAFVWAAISWMILPWQHSQFRRFSDEEAVTRVLLDNAPQTGLYGIPAPPDGKGLDKAEREALEARAGERMRSGPLVLLVFQRNGFGSFPVALLRAYLIYCAIAFLLCLVAMHLAPGTLLGRAPILDAAALAGAAACRLPDWSWHGYPLRYALVSLADAAIGWFLAGLVVAAIVSPR